jgi:hypothetical protein
VSIETLVVAHCDNPLCGAGDEGDGEPATFQLEGSGTHEAQLLRVGWDSVSTTRRNGARVWWCQRCLRIYGLAPRNTDSVLVFGGDDFTDQGG